MSRRWIAVIASAALAAAIAIVAVITTTGATAHTGTPASSTSASSVLYRWGHVAEPGSATAHKHKHGQGHRTHGAGSSLTASPGGTPSPTTVPGVPGRIVSIATSNSDSYALTSTGAVYAVGAGSQGELGDGSTRAGATTRAVRVHFPAGVRITSLPNPMPYDGGMAIDSRGDVWAWGNDAHQQFCQSSTADIDTPVKVPVSHVSLAAGALLHTIYDSSGHVVSCGIGKDGQLGNGSSGTASQTDTPVAVRGLPSGRVVALTSSWGDAGVLMANGSYYDWGYDKGGQVGDGTTTEQNTAVRVSLPDGVRTVSQGGSLADNGQTMAILRDGQLWEWGNGHFGQMGDGQTINRLSPFQLTEPRGVPFVAVNSGGATNYAIDRSGQLYAWGHDNWGQVGDGHKSGRQLTPVRDAVTLKQVSSTASEVAGLGVHGSAR